MEVYIDWAYEEQNGLPRWAWLIIGAVLVLMLCCGMCYMGNHPGWTEKIDACCPENDFDPNEYNPNCKFLGRKPMKRERRCSQTVPRSETLSK